MQSISAEAMLEEELSISTHHRTKKGELGELFVMMHLPKKTRMFSANLLDSQALCQYGHLKLKIHRLNTKNGLFLQTIQ